MSYLIQLPKGKHCYHNTGKAAGIAEPFDPRVTDFIQKLIRSGCRQVKELESRAMDFVADIFFEGAYSPDRYRGKFGKFTLNDVKLEVSLLMLKWTRFSKIDQENVHHSVSSCREAKIHFTPR